MRKRTLKRGLSAFWWLTLVFLYLPLAVFVFAAHSPWTALPVLFAIGAAGSAVAPALQTRLMDVAHDAQTLAAALNHSALNIGNATGAWVGGLVIAAGLGAIYLAAAAARRWRSGRLPAGADASRR